MKRVISVLYLAALSLGCGAEELPGATEAGDAHARHSDTSAGEGDGLAVEEAPEPLPPMSSWESGDAPLQWTPWVATKPWLTDVSSWAHLEEVVEGPLVHRHLPDFGVGNGHVFSLIGYGRPINALHSMVGPYYHKGEGFFGDVSVDVLDASGGALVWEREWAGWVRGAPVVHTQALSAEVNLSTVDFAPLVGGSDDASRRALLRFVIVRNLGESPLVGHDLVVKCARVQEVVDGTLVEVREDRTRHLVAVDEDQVTAEDWQLRVPLGELEAGAERVVLLANIFDDDKGLAEETVQGLSQAQALADLELTIATWRARTSEATVLETPDERVNDYLEGQRTIILAQQGYNGSSHPMSEYTGVWLRDQAGPVRYLLTSGMEESAREMLDYLWLAALAQGEILNSNFGDFQPSDAAPEPDWAAQGVMDGRERAESPSYVPLMHAWYWQATGRGDFFAERLAWMRACLDNQDLRDDLLPFSTDETFRTAMAAAHGHLVIEQFAEGFLSANSSFLWVAAAEGLAEMSAAILGEAAAEVTSHYTERALALRSKAEATYASDSGAYHPYVYEEDLSPAPAPFEDVNTKPLWSGYVSPDDPEASEQLSALIEALDGQDGVLVSPLPEDFEPVLEHPMSEGIYTGMSPGYYLSNLAQTHHPLAMDAFNALALHATPSGATPEYHILDDYGPLHAVYDPNGATGDYPARFRPWEGGILADAAYAYLLGNRCDAMTGTLSLAPNLPNDWPWLHAHRVRCAQARLDLRIDATRAGWTLTLSHLEGPAVTLDLRLPFAASVTVDGATDDAVIEEMPWGNRLTRLTPLELDGGQVRTIHARL